MTGPSPWRLPSPRGGMTSVTVSGSTNEPVGSIILLPVPITTILLGPNTSSEDGTRNRHAKSGVWNMNLTLVAAVALLLLWGILVFAMQFGSGPVQILYALSVVLFARRIIAGAPTILSCTDCHKHAGR